MWLVLTGLDSGGLPHRQIKQKALSQDGAFFFPVAGNLVSTRYRQAGGLARLDSRRLPAGRAPGMVRVNPDPAPN